MAEWHTWQCHLPRPLAISVAAAAAAAAFWAKDACDFYSLSLFLSFLRLLLLHPLQSISIGLMIRAHGSSRSRRCATPQTGHLSNLPLCCAFTLSLQQFSHSAHFVHLLWRSLSRVAFLCISFRFISVFSFPSSAAIWPIFQRTVVVGAVAPCDYACVLCDCRAAETKRKCCDFMRQVLHLVVAKTENQTAGWRATLHARTTNGTVQFQNIFIGARHWIKLLRADI